MFQFLNFKCVQQMSPFHFLEQQNIDPRFMFQAIHFHWHVAENYIISSSN